MTTGVFFHPEFIGKDWPIVGDRYRNFAPILDGLSKVEGVKLFTPKPVSEDLISEVHTREMLEAQRKMWYFEGARLTDGARKLTYIDTDSHHGDGARDILREDADVLHICFCSADRREGSKVCINADLKLQMSST
jgi:acetoin utilization deacetylase AcuC-like enzyme